MKAVELNYYFDICPSPTLKNGSMIIVDRHLATMSDGIYLMHHDNNLLVKRLQILPTGSIKVKSDNTRYEPWEVHKADFNGTDLELIGRVVWTGQDRAENVKYQGLNSS